MVVSALAEANTPPRHLVLIDPKPHGGEAFGQAAPEHYLNTRARVMGLTAVQCAGFTQWLAERLGIPQAEAAIAFAPRSLYGAFLRERLDAALTALSNQGWQIENIKAAAVAVHPNGSGFRIETTAGIAHTDQAVLALGPSRASAIPGALSPWSLDLSHVAAGSGTAVVIGAGLTAADAIVRLDALGWQGPITSYSLTGERPIAQSTEPCATLPPWITPAQPTAAQLVRRVRSEAAATLATGHALLSYLDGLRPQTARLWAALPPGQRHRLLRSTRFAVWSRLRHRLPAPTGAIIERLVAAGKLTFARGRVEEIKPGQIRLAHSETPVPAALVVDGRGFDLSYRQEPLIQQLLRSGLAQPCATGFGFAPDATLRIGTQGRQLYALGACLSGALLETTAAAEIRAQAGVVAAALTQASCHLHQ
jgi:uncharacterized NAD(P)/FAD-binding protein YdhS